MSIWISKGSWLAALALLAGCVTSGNDIRSVALLDGAVTAVAPTGYCIAPAVGQRGADSAVVLMGRCRAGTEASPAMLTLSVGAAGSAGAMTAGGEALAAYFTSAPGRAALSRDGQAGDVVVLEAVSAGDAFLLHVRDRVVGDYWRAILGLRGRLVTLSVAGPEGQPLEADKGRRLLDAAVAALKRANANPAATVAG
jgi:hypothetical protein